MTGSTFDLEDVCTVLSRTPTTLDTWLRDLPAEWTRCNEGPDTFSPFDVLGHLIHGERTDWIPRLELILEHGEKRTFDPVDRLAQKRVNQDQVLPILLDEFAQLRKTSLMRLRSLQLDDDTLSLRGSHPVFGPVTVRQLLATWVVHDLGHIAQIARVMAKRYSTDVGPWSAYLPVLTRR